MTAWNAIYKTALVILCILALAAVGVAYYKPLKERQNLTARKVETEQAVKLQQDKLDDLKQKQERLQTDPRFVEKIAREEFGYAKPGEVVFKFDGDLASSAGKHPAH